VNIYNGQQLGNYRLGRLLGRGGYAEVYLGAHRYLETPVAIKILHTSTVEREAFLQEARLVAHLSHPHIVSVLEFDIQDTIPFLVMDYIPNGTLRQRYPRGARLSLQQVVNYIKQIASALHYTHTKSIVHGDVKPENVLIAEDGRVLLSDFGLANMIEMTESQQGQNLVGTVDYMAPEQFQHQLLPASDQYALGIMAYEWLSGRPPFEGLYVEIAMQHVLGPVEPLLSSVPGLPVDVDEVIRHALAKDPGDRFASVEVFAHALEVAAQQEEAGLAETRLAETKQAMPYEPSEMSLDTTIVPVDQHTQNAPLSATTVASRHVISRRGMIGVISGAVVLGAGLLLAEIIAHSHSSQQEQTTNYASEKLTATVTSPDAMLYVHHGPTYSMDALAWSPDGQYIASGGGRTQKYNNQVHPIQIWKALTGQLISTFTGHTDSIYTIAWSPDGTQISSGGTGDPSKVEAIWDAKTGILLEQVVVHSLWVNNIFWLPGNRTIVSSSDDGNVCQIAVGMKNNKNTQDISNNLYSLGGASVNDPPDFVSDLLCAPNQQYVSMIGHQGIRVVQIANKQQLAYFRKATTKTVLVLWSPDSTRIASYAEHGMLYVWKATTGDILVSFTGDTVISAAGWSADSKYIASCGSTMQIQTWDAGTGKILHKHARKSTSIVRSITWSPDGKMIACGCDDGTVEIWHAFS
jgi:serine/threonine protein kinase